MSTLLLLSVACLCGLQEPPADEGASTPVPSAWRIELANGQVQRALAVREDGALVQMSFSGGTLAVPAREVVAIAPEAPAPPPMAEVIAHTITIDGLPLRLALPSDFQRDPSPPDGVSAFHSPDASIAVRVASGGSSKNLWHEPRFVKSHHAETYPGFQTIEERFTRLGTHDAWLISFRYNVGQTLREECQALIALDSLLVVVSVTTPPHHQPSASSITLGVARSIATPQDQ